MSDFSLGRLPSRLVFCIACVFLVGCTSPRGQAAWSTFRAAFLDDPSTQVDSAVLRPEFSYLRVRQGESLALMVLGEIDTNANGPVEVWYSAKGEILRLQEGRIVGLTGVQKLSVPQVQIRWIAKDVYERVSDELPSYRTSVVDRLRISPNVRPSESIFKGFRQKDLLRSDRVVWQAEWVEASNSAPYKPLSYVAFKSEAGSQGVGSDKGPVVRVAVAGYQCLRADFCLVWERLISPVAVIK